MSPRMTRVGAVMPVTASPRFRWSAMAGAWRERLRFSSTVSQSSPCMAASCSATSFGIFVPGGAVGLGRPATVMTGASTVNVQTRSGQSTARRMAIIPPRLTP